MNTKAKSKAKGSITELPEFSSPQEEREWWDKHHDEIDYEALPIETFVFDVEPPSRRKKPVTIRMDPALIERYKRIASKKGMGYQTLMHEVLSRWHPGAARE